MGVGGYIKEHSGTIYHITDKGDNCPSGLGTGSGVYLPNQPVSPIFQISLVRGPG
jgi:hypothetical protein